jgi:hypothetical protein
MTRFFHSTQPYVRQASSLTRVVRAAVSICIVCVFPLFSSTQVKGETTSTAQIPIETVNPALPSHTPTKADTQYWMLEDLLKMREFIDTTVPGTLEKYKLVVSFSPRFADANKGEFIRLPVTVRYGLKKRWEIYGGLTPFSPNPINSGKEHRWGLGEARLGVRYDWGHWGKVFDHVTLGLEGRTPLGKPPYDLIDYYTHVVPFINTSRPLPFKYTTLYTNLSYDRSIETPDRAPAPLPPDIVRHHIFTVTPSVLYKPGEFGGFVEYNWRHIEDQVKGTHLGHEIKAGPLWDVPLWRTQSWGLPGKWQVELAGRVSFEEGERTSHGVSLRVRWRTTIREVLTKKSYERIPHT